MCPIPCFSNFQVHTNHVGILTKCSFSKSGVAGRFCFSYKLLIDADAAAPGTLV